MTLVSGDMTWGEMTFGRLDCKSLHRPRQMLFTLTIP